MRMLFEVRSEAPASTESAAKTLQEHRRGSQESPKRHRRATKSTRREANIAPESTQKEAKRASESSKANIVKRTRDV